MRFAPASSMVFTSARVRIPPEAFTPQRPPATPRIRATSAAVAPPPANPVDVLMKSAPAWIASSAPRKFFLYSKQGGFEDHLEDGSVMMCDVAAA